MKRWAADREKIFSKCKPDKGVASKIHKELSKFNNKKRTQLKNGQNIWTDSSPEKTHGWPRSACRGQGPTGTPAPCRGDAGWQPQQNTVAVSHNTKHVLSNRTLFSLDNTPAEISATVDETWRQVCDVTSIARSLGNYWKLYRKRRASFCEQLLCVCVVLTH